MKLSGKNFQSWAYFDINIEGLTVLTGPSDVGKSALFRALRGVLRNELPAEFVRNGQDDAMEVRLVVGGHEVVASRKRKGSSHYTIDGQEFAKLAGAVPDQVKDLKFGEVIIGDFDVDPIFGRQNSAQFLIDPLTYKPTEVNAILGAFGGTEKLEHGKKEANLRKTQKDAEARTLANQIRDAEERRAKLETLQPKIEALSDEAHSLGQDVVLLEMDIDWLDVALRYRQEIVRYRQILDALVLPDISGLEEEQRLIQFAQQGALAASYAKWLHKPVRKLEDISTDWKEATDLRAEITALETACAAREKSEWLFNAVEGLQSAPVLWTDVRRLWNEIAALEGAIESGKHVISTDRLKSSQSDVETTFSEVVRLWNGIKRLEVLSTLLEELKGSVEKLAGVEAELSAAQAELQKGLCPKCGKPIQHICQ